VLDELRRIPLLETLKELLDSEVITFALFQQLRGVESERSFLREVALFFWHLFPGAAGLQSPSLQRRVRKLLVATSSPCGAPSCPSWWHLSVPLLRVSPTNQLRACADRLATFHYLSVLRTIKWAPHHSLIHSLPAYPRSLL
jgi:hypothetical protein